MTPWSWWTFTAGMAAGVFLEWALIKAVIWYARRAGSPL
jgi:hypothetical protein